MRVWVISCWAAFKSWWQTHSNNAFEISQLKSFTDELISEKTKSAAESSERLAESDNTVAKLTAITSELNQEVARLAGENEVLKAQIDMYTDWEARERARLEAEADMWRRRGDGSSPPTDELV
jgi:septal ring factor EnvC (AmiA/AmiB activator)